MPDVLDLPTPQNATELAEVFDDPKRRGQIMANQADLVSFISQYAANQATRDPGQAKQISDQAQALFTDWLRDKQIENINRLNLSPEPTRAVRNSKHYYAKAPGAGLDKQFPEWGPYLTATWDGAKGADAMQKQDQIQRIQNAFGSAVPADGGFLIPERLRSELLRVSLETAVVRSRARTIPMETLSVPYPMIDTTTNSGSVYGGIVGYWTEESGTLTESSPQFGRINLLAKKLTLYSEVPNELYQDSILALQQFMDEVYPEALSFFEDVAFLTGSGVGMPLGVFNSPATETIAAESGQPAGTIVWENLIKMYARMLPGSLNRAVWVANLDTFPQLATMALSIGTGGSAVWIGNSGGESSGAAAPPVTILGRPVIFTEKSPSVGTAGDISFIDFGYYLIGDRMTMQSNTSTDFRFNTDKTAFRLIERVDGTPWIRQSITPNVGANKLSPFVRIATR